MSRRRYKPLKTCINVVNEDIIYLCLRYDMLKNDLVWRTTTSWNVFEWWLLKYNPRIKFEVRFRWREFNNVRTYYFRIH